MVARLEAMQGVDPWERLLKEVSEDGSTEVLQKYATIHDNRIPVMMQPGCSKLLQNVWERTSMPKDNVSLNTIFKYPV